MHAARVKLEKITCFYLQKRALDTILSADRAGTARHWQDKCLSSVSHQRLMEACALLSASTNMRRQFQGHQLGGN